MKHFIVVALTAFAITAVIPVIAQKPCNLALSGHVEDADTKERLTGATVELIGLQREVTTDEKGDFRFNDLCAGTYTILITHVDCQPIQQEIPVQKDRHQDFFLPHALNTLGEVKVATKTGTASTGLKEELSGVRLEQTRGMSLAEAFSKINGVTMLQTGATIAKPVIHGLHSSRILTINNGVRQEGQQWGNEHAPEIDPFIADKLTVIKGVDELRYGSDAIGGVLIIQPKPLRTTPGYDMELNTGYFTNNRQYYASAVYEQQFKKLPAFTYRLQGTFKQGENVQTPDYRLNNTASIERNFSATAMWRKDHFNTELFYSFFSTKAGLFIGSHTGSFDSLNTAITADKPDDVFLGQNTYKIGRPYQDVEHQILKSKSQWISGTNKFNLILAGQFNNRKEFDVVRSSTNTAPQLNLTISTFTEELNWEHKLGNNISGVAGLSAMQQDNAYAGRYFIPNYTSETYGGYLIEKWNKQKWDVQAGLRFDHKTVETNRLRLGASNTFANHDFEYNTFAASANVGYNIRGNLKTNVNVSLSQRAPYVNELLTDGIHHGTSTYEVGDIYLKPEKALNITWNTTWHNDPKTVLVELDIYDNHINDFIFQQPIPDEPVLTTTGAYRKVEYKQTDAELYGTDLSVTVKPVTRLDWTSRMSLLRAKNKTLGDWLINMPADRIGTELQYNFKNNSSISDAYVSAEIQQVFRQTRVPSDKFGPQDYKAPPDGYALVNFNSSATFHMGHQPFTLSIGVRNLLDRRYRDYLDGMRYFTDEMGRNISFKLKVPIGHN